MRIETRRLGVGEPHHALVVPVKDARDEITARFLTHLGRCTELPLEVLLVESSGPEFSFGRSINAGVRAAEGHGTVVCMDSDAFPEKGAIDRLISCIENDKRLGYAAAVAYSRTVPPNIGWARADLLRFIARSVMSRAPLFALRRLRLGGWWFLGVRNPSRYLPGRMIGASTTAFAVRRESFDELDGFDERFHVSLSDQDFCYRMMLSERWYLTSCPSALVFHDEHATRKAPKEREEFQDWSLFLEKWPRGKVEELLEAARKGKFVVPKHRRVPTREVSERPWERM